MRVIAGTARGRGLKAVPGMSTRPTTDKVKEALFSMIGPFFDGGEALDLFAGTGGLGIEALSRGMSRAVFIDMEKKSIDTVLHNLQATGLKEQAEVYRNDAFRALKALAKREKRFALVFLDPPYRMKVIAELLESLESLQLLADDAVIVVEHDAEDWLEEAAGALRQRRRVAYGDTALTIYETTREPNVGSE
ncbi:16S rRNA (guanine(966)-N(2))-methyltransferase RsmD [Paenibacillus athensensis]|uniref:16S rRNA (Guanine(966)-N(2))-methyltransferase RsmD n=1 Tax=Paenibacillus athensensis TaxID=1967502 RepID=A0A4Y8PX11_9BACL|nr:16S rRNA (guanine(966)-N(2))-methyltransferase RsmD [Paenibacillus athensensis]MCD1257874.1 16S rRNA (guanine(966)-N(2))-methyltransferase RsmD [Paenibacillus athensensis]